MKGKCRKFSMKPRDDGYAMIGVCGRREYAHRKRHGTQDHGDRHPHAKVTDSRVLDVIERMYREKKTKVWAARELGLSRPYVFNILSGTWRNHLQKQIREIRDSTVDTRIQER